MLEKDHGNTLGQSDVQVTLDRRDFLSRIPIALGVLSSPILKLRASYAISTTSDVVAKTVYGRIRGASKDGVIVFKGIPYAGSPSGEHRFKRAPKLKPWTGTRDARLYGAQSIQPSDPAWPKEWKAAVSNESCLYLNVWTQGIGKGRKRPVMFYSHGGGFATGNGGADVPPQDTMHDGAALAKDYDVVVVTHNHRLGIMGYLYLADLLGQEYAASGAAGMLDIAAALEWVRDNIEEFGGDPDNVMIWGESGGGAKTSTLTALPQAQGLFHRASIESGSTLRLRTRESAMATTRAALSSLGLNEKQAREILKIPVERLIEAQLEISRRPPPAATSVSSALAGGLGFSPVVDGQYIPNHPYDPVAPAMSARVPLIVGINKDETIFMFRSMPEVFSLDDAGLRQRLESTFKDKTNRILEVYHRTRPGASPTDLYIAITTAQWMWINAVTMAERKAALNAAPVFMYIFAYELDTPVRPDVKYRMKAAHAMEIPFKFNHATNDEPETKQTARLQATRNMSKAWATFARTGNPSHEDIPKWPAYTLDQRATMFLDSQCKVVNDPHREERLLWNEIKL
jgi:para-nitrobenzyl esterase